MRPRQLFGVTTSVPMLLLTLLAATCGPAAAPPRRPASPARSGDGPSVRKAVSPQRRAVAPPAARPWATREPGLQRVRVAGKWKLEASLELERSRFMVAEPIYLTFRLRNRSQVNLRFEEGGDYRNRLGRPDRYRLSATGADGKRLPVRSSGPAFGGRGGLRTLTAGGEFEIELLLPLWVRFKKPGRYRLTLDRTLNITLANRLRALIPVRRPAARPPARKGSRRRRTPPRRKRIDIPLKIQVDVVVLPNEKVALAALVTELGELVNGNNHQRRQKALKALGQLQHPAVIPALIKAATSHRTDVRMAAVTSLAGFRDPRALAVLKACRKERQRWVRNNCANALSKSVDPAAGPLLLGLASDRNANIRLKVLHYLGKQACTAKVRAALQAFVKDKSSRNGREAKRYLKACAAKPAARPRATRRR